PTGARSSVDRVTDYESGGRRFESSRARQLQRAFWLTLIDRQRPLSVNLSISRPHTAEKGKPAGASLSGRCRVPGLWLGVGFDGGRPVKVLVEEPDGFLFVVLQGMGVAPGREAGVMMAHHLGN